MGGDFSLAIVARPAAPGDRIAYHGRELVRVPRMSELTLDARYDPVVLRHLTVLKLSDDETAVLAATHGRESALESFSDIPASLLALGFRDADIHIGSTASHVAPDRVVANVQTSGAGTSNLAAAVR